jgi:hypothetical protein
MFRRIAELFFERQLDEDFALGVKEGRRQAQADLTFKLELSLEASNKSKQPGISQALEIVRNHR